ncbi:MAG: D-sedoheptulose 7-phosphate isomerase [Gaiellaceae bacterium]|jgi:D-sedoheptulose 7-phosphate isomerase|nr:D-sedoheptulose 7-phosphate isomerase [Gaiellaceae bacterium]
MADDASDLAEHDLAEHLELAARVEGLLPVADTVAQKLIEVYEAGGRLYTFGNGGSSVDAQHFAEELVGRFQRERAPLPAQSLASDAAALTCIANDYSFEEVFERQVRAFVRGNDMVIAFSTSGRSPNVVRGLAAAREAGATTVLFGGGDGGPAAEHADHALLIPSTSTARIQELHVFFLHVVIEQVDRWAAG